MKQRKALINRIMNTLLCMLYILLGSCQNQNQKIKNLTTNEDGKYWDIYKSKDAFDSLRSIVYERGNYGYCYYFSKTGECFYYYYEPTDNYGGYIRKRFPFGDVVYANTWNFKNDNVIQIQDFDYHIILLNDKEIILSNAVLQGDTLHLVKSERR
jgi:hypothetical protein